MLPDFNFVFRNSQRERFRSGALVKEWRERYPDIFDKDDVRVVRTELQRKYNFLEWLAAVLIFESTGHLSLVAKYTAKAHPGKHTALRGCLPHDLAQWVFMNQSGQPDLFVYSADYQLWYFCEVKGPGDTLKPNQIKWRHDFLELVNTGNLGSHVRYRVFTVGEIDA